METSVNNKCRAFTSLEQSKKLAEILPLESADMCYRTWIPLDDIPICISYTEGVELLKSSLDLSANKKIKSLVPSWSLSALLGVLPEGTRLLKSTNISSIGDTKHHCDCPKGNIDVWFDNPVDACVAMIEKLHELKKL